MNINAIEELEKKGVDFRDTKGTLVICPDDYEGDFSIPQGVTRIADDAFSGCTKITSLTIPDSIKVIGRTAFYRCEKITSINIPKSVNCIMDEAFSNCFALKKITFPKRMDWLGKNILFECHSFKKPVYANTGGSKQLMKVPDSFEGEFKIPNGVCVIGENAFGERVSSVVIPDSVNSIQDNAFAGCKKLTNVKIPDSVHHIGKNIFSGCIGLEEPIYAYKGTTLVRVPYNFEGEFVVPEGVTNIEGAFEECCRLTSVVIPSSVTEIGNSTFKKCSSLTSIVFPQKSITRFGNYAFEFCSSLESINIPASVEEIGEGAFANCESMTSLVIPESIIYISEHAISHCKNLKSITFNGIGANNIISDCDKLEEIIIPKGSYDKFVTRLPDFTKLFVEQ